MQTKNLALLFSLLMLVACSSTPQPSPNIFWPSEFWDARENDPGYQMQAQRFATNLEAAFAHQAILDTLQARLLLGPDNGYRMIDGNELIKMTYEGPVLFRHTNGGDQNPDGTWNRGCFGSLIQNRFRVYEHLQRIRPDLRVVEVHTDENSGCSEASDLIFDWGRQTRRKLRKSSPDGLFDFYKYWGIVRYNRDIEDWDVAVRTPWKRRSTMREASCGRWTWKLTPSTPYVFLLRNGKVVKVNGHYPFIIGTPPILFQGHEIEQAIIQKQIKGFMQAEDREAFSKLPIPEDELYAGEYVAQAILRELGLF